MTKLRAPLSFEDALDRVSGAVGGKPALALRCGRKERTVRNWGDPDTPEQIPVDVALDFDLFYAEQGGIGSPFLEAFAHQREQLELARHCDRVALGRQAADVIRECGEAGSALVVAAQPGATPRDRQEALRECTEAYEKLKQTLPLLLDEAVAPAEALGPQPFPRPRYPARLPQAAGANAPRSPAAIPHSIAHPARFRRRSPFAFNRSTNP